MSEYKRFILCKQCFRNANEGFTGPPECDLEILPAMNGTCDKYTKEAVAAPVKELVSTIAKATLEKALTLLKPVASRARFAGSSPIMVAVAPGNGLELRAADGETDIRLTRGTVNGNALRAVVPYEVFLAAATKEPVSIKVIANGLDVCGTGVAGVTTQTSPGPFDVGESGLAVDVPKLTGSCTYLVRAVNRDEQRPALRYILMELPNFTFVATDGHRMHVQYAKREEGRAEARVLLTKEQLALLWADLAQKQIAVTSKGCIVFGTMDTLQAEMAFTTGTGQFPEWRTLFHDEGMTTVSMPLDMLRLHLRNEGKLYEVGTPPAVKVLKEYVNDVIVGWEEERVSFGYTDDQSPVIVSNGTDRRAVLIYATEVEATEPVAKEGAVKEKKEKVKKEKPAVVQTSAPVAPAVKNYVIGQEVATPTGNATILKDRVAYLVQLPSGKKRWFSQDGLQQFVAGKPVEEEAASEAAA